MVAWRRLLTLVLIASTAAKVIAKVNQPTAATDNVKAQDQAGGKKATGATKPATTSQRIPGKTQIQVILRRVNSYQIGASGSGRIGVEGPVMAPVAACHMLHGHFGRMGGNKRPLISRTGS